MMATIGTPPAASHRAAEGVGVKTPQCLTGGCPKTPLRPRSQVTDSVRPEFPVLDAQKEWWWSQWVDATPDRNLSAGLSAAKGRSRGLIQTKHPSG